MGKSIVVLGGPDSGKTNYLGRLWHALDTKAGQLVAASLPLDLNFVMDTAEHLFEGHFAPHTGRGESRRNFEITVRPANGLEETAIVVPDISGEIWTSAVTDSEIASEWMEELKNAGGALLFVRVDSDQNKKPLDWVTASRLLERIGQHDAERTALPTQVMLCELIRFLEFTMARSRPVKPRLSVIVSAWDRVSQDIFKKGPIEFLKREYPLFAGRLDDTDLLDVKFFGLSVVGGDLTDDPKFRDSYLEGGIDGKGWVAMPDGKGRWMKHPDLTAPIAWAMGGLL